MMVEWSPGDSSAYSGPGVRRCFARQLGRTVFVAVVGIALVLSAGTAYAFAGIYNGTYEGGTNGFFTVTIDASGSISGIAISEFGPEGFLVGQLDPNGSGDFSGSVAGQDVQFTGQVTPDGVFSGTWAAEDESGTFLGTREFTGAASIQKAKSDLVVNAAAVQRNSIYRQLENRRYGGSGTGAKLALNLGGSQLSSDMLLQGASGMAQLAMGLGRYFDDSAEASARGRRRLGGSLQQGLPGWLEVGPEPRAFAMASGDEGGSGADSGSELGGSGWSLFANGNVTLAERDTVAGQAGSKTTAFGATLGADRRFQNRAVLGFGAGYTRDNTEFKAGGGDASANAAYLMGYGSGAIGPGGYIDGMLSFGWIGYDSSRRLGAVTGSTNGAQVWGGLTGGWDFNIWKVTLGPYLRLNGGSAWLAPYEESGPGALAFDLNTIWNLSIVAGGRGDIPFSTPIGVFVPYARIEYVHEFGAEPSNRIGFVSGGGGALISSSLDRDFLNAGAGVSAVLPRGWSLFADWDGLFGANDLSRNSITFGVRLEI